MVHAFDFRRTKEVVRCNFNLDRSHFENFILSRFDGIKGFLCRQSVDEKVYLLANTYTLSFEPFVK
jgi:hypothetical protein